MSAKYVEKDGDKFPSFWKVLHVGIYCSIFILGLANFIPFGNIKNHFNGICPLYANYTLQKADNNTFNVKVIHGSEHVCSFVLYSSVCSAIYAFFLGWFFILCGKGGNSQKGLPQPWRLVSPTFLLSLAFSILVLISSIYLTKGFGYLCKSLEMNPFVESCSKSTVLKWNGYNHIEGFHAMLTATEATCWVQTTLWIIATFILLARCCLPADFDVVEDHIFDEKVRDIESEDEQIIQIQEKHPYDYQKLKNYPDSD